MTTMEVSSVVRSILEAFGHGRDIFARMRRGKHRKGGRPRRMSEDELRLHDSLTNRPKEIEAEFTQSVVKHGKRFEHGDNTTYSSLAHTLFVLNTGMIHLINSTLSSSDATDKMKSRASLLLLSESAAINTMQALTELDKRLSIPTQLAVVPHRNHGEQRSARPSTNPTVLKRPPPTPLLDRGGWVRAKSGSSVVSVVSPRKLNGQNSNHGRSKSSPSCPASAPSRSTSDSSTQIVSHSSKDQANRPEALLNDYTLAPPGNRPPKEKERAPSMILVPASYFDNHFITCDEIETGPTRPADALVHVRPNPRTRPRPPSAATFLTASTRIGEIPERKWSDRVVPEEEQMQRPLPYIIPPPLEPLKRKRRGLKFWKRADSREATAVF